MLKYGDLRQLYVSEGPVAFSHKWSAMLGLGTYDPKRRDIVRPRNGDLRTNPVLEDVRAIAPSEVSLKGLAQAIFGPTSDDELASKLIGGGLPLGSMSINALESLGQAWVQEAGENVPSQFSNISAYNSAALGLLEAKMLEVWNRPDFMVDSLMETIPSDLRSQKFIGVGIPGNLDTIRNPADPHIRVNLPERYVTTPDTQNRGAGIDITREATMFDRTSQLLANAERIVEGLRIGKENRCSDVIVGATNTYKYDGTTYNTYVASGGNWVNIMYSNPLTAFDAVSNAMKLASMMTDQETGQPVSVTGKELVVSPVKILEALHLVRSTTVETLPSGGSSGTRRNFGANPLAQVGMGNPQSSIWLWNRLWAYLRATYPTTYSSDALAQAAADGVWLWGDFKGAFVYVENLPFTTQRATPDSYTMVDRGLMASLFVDEMGIGAVREPRKVQFHFPSTAPT